MFWSFQSLDSWIWSCFFWEIYQKMLETCNIPMQQLHQQVRFDSWTFFNEVSFFCFWFCCFAIKLSQNHRSTMFANELLWEIIVPRS